MMTQPFVLEYSCGNAVPLLAEVLAKSGLEITQSFDLRLAASRMTGLVGKDQFRTLLAIPDDCVCPKHGTAGCDCQMVVLIVYGSAASPATLVAHGHDGRTWLSLVNTPEQRPDPALAAVIIQSLRELGCTLPSGNSDGSQEVRL